ncbi:MAG: GNAT family N-acetyltransferase [Bacteroidetes bacterium]|nr:GNAT family N-acetyltransferase [Bacteroidota bacterium]
MNLKPVIRPYLPKDKNQVIQLLQLNTPAYFSEDEEKDLVHYLDHEIEHYFVVELNDTVIGCGGFNFSEDSATGKISWDILHPDFQGKSVGTLLLKYRIERLQTFNELKRIIVRTSQQAYRFYEKSGFVLLETSKDYWAKGFDLYLMEYQGVRRE